MIVEGSVPARAAKAEQSPVQSAYGQSLNTALQASPQTARVLFAGRALRSSVAGGLRATATCGFALRKKKESVVSNRSVPIDPFPIGAFPSARRLLAPQPSRNGSHRGSCGWPLRGARHTVVCAPRGSLWGVHGYLDRIGVATRVCVFDVGGLRLVEALLRRASAGGRGVLRDLRLRAVCRLSGACRCSFSQLTRKIARWATTALFGSSRDATQGAPIRL